MSKTVSAGKCITYANKPLVKISVEYLRDSIRSPKSEIASLIRQLRIVRSIDRSRYSQLKRSLPYIVCGNFNPPYRRTENFSYTDFFIVDIDNLSDKEIEVEDIRAKIQSDSRVMMCFLSPSQDGLKVMFAFSERCYDAGKYSIFYREFVRSFSSQYGLEQVVDAKTSDVCRACFVSDDPYVYYNEHADTVKIEDYINTDEGAWSSFKTQVKRECEKTDVVVEPSEDEYARIREILQLNRSHIEKKQNVVHVPQQLEDVMEDLSRYVESTGALIQEVININYGKKIKVQMNGKLAEVNVFYGKRGFSVVISPRVGTNQELNKLIHELIDSYLKLYCA